MEDLNIKKKKRLIIISIFSTIIIVLGSAYAFFTYFKSASAFVLTSSSISASFTEGTNQINLTNAYPISDEYAIENLNNLDYIDFTVSGNAINSSEAITYEIFLTEKSGNTLANNYIKTYVTDNNGLKITDPALYGSLTNTTYTNEPNGKIVLKRTYTSTFTKSYRLYIWLDSSYEQNTVSETFSFYVNLYAYNDTSSKALVDITFDPDGGVVSPNRLQGNFDVVTGFPTPTRDGYIFTGWYDESDNKVTEANVGGGTTTLTAHWSKNRYNLIIDPSGGVYETNIGKQTYILDYEEEKEISNPTKSGYNFTGWDLTGEGSTLSNNVFTMGSSNATLKATYAIGTYKLTVNPNGGTWNNSNNNQEFNIQYKKTKAISNPTKEGYTFTGWTLTGEGSLLSGTTFTMGLENATLTANYTVNNYDYIIYHNKMNVDGNGYTLVEVETGNGNFGETFEGTLKNYPGFTNPTRESKTIGESDNVLNYNYTRNQYNLIINPNSGTYNNTTSNTTTSMYYEATTTLQTPTRTGYSFTNWTKTGSGTIDGTTFTQGVGETTLLANWTLDPITINSFTAQSNTIYKPSEAYSGNRGSTTTVTLNYTGVSPNISYSSSRSSVATVTKTSDTTATITAVAPGEASITVTISYYDSNHQAETMSIPITVENVGAVNIEFTPIEDMTCNGNDPCDLQTMLEEIAGMLD